MNSDNISVLIRIRNGEQYVGFALQSVFDEFVNPEVIMLSDRCDDETLEIVQTFNSNDADYHNSKRDIKIYSVPQPYTPGSALNYGVEKANRDTILVLSSHCQIDTIGPYGFGKIEELLNDQGYVAVFGDQTPIWRGKKISKNYVWSHFGTEDQQNMWSKIENRFFLHNAFCFYSKEELQQNKFNESMQGKEDREWAKRMVDNGKSYFYYSQAECNHFWTPPGATWKGLG